MQPAAYVRMLVIRFTAAEFTAANQVLPLRQLAYETDTGKWKRGDGKTAWNALGYLN